MLLVHGAETACREYLKYTLNLNLLCYNVTFLIRYTSMLNISRFTPSLDKYAISTSAICAIHCLCLPLMLSFFPALSSSLFGQERFHVLLLFLVIPLSLVSLSIGCKRHKSRFVASFGLSGIIVLIFTATAGHDLLGEIGERVATVVGATLIAIGHLRNYRLCRQVQCEH